MTMRMRLTAALLALLGTLGMAGTAQAVDAGQAAPDVELPASTVAARLSDLKGQWVYVDFWASWCGPCRLSFSFMNDMQQKYAARGLKIVAINVDAKRPDADQFLARNPASFGLAFDAKGESARRLGIKAMPTSMLVAPDGTVKFVHAGFRQEERAELEAKLAAALGGRS